MLSRTVPTADAGIPKDVGLRVSGVVIPLVDELLLFGLITSRPTGTNTTIRMRTRLIKMKMTSVVRLHLLRGIFSPASIASADSIGHASTFFSSAADAPFSEGSVKGLFSATSSGSTADSFVARSVAIAPPRGTYDAGYESLSLVEIEGLEDCRGGGKG